MGSKMRRHYPVFYVLVGLVMVAASCESFECSEARRDAIKLSNEGVELIGQGDLQRAERRLETAIATDPTYPVPRHMLGKLFQKQKKWAQAVTAFEGALEVDGSNASMHFDLGESYFEDGKLAKAETAFQDAAKFDPKLWRAHWRLGQVATLSEAPDQADAAFRRAIELNPRVDYAFNGLGSLYLAWDFAKQAEQVYSECVRINPTSTDCLSGQGLALKELGQFPAAARAFERVLQAAPGVAAALYNVGMTYADWYDTSRDDAHKEKAKGYLKKFVSRGGGKGGAGYAKAASDKIYALSAP